MLVCFEALNCMIVDVVWNLLESLYIQYSYRGFNIQLTILSKNRCIIQFLDKTKKRIQRNGLSDHPDKNGDFPF